VDDLFIFRNQITELNFAIAINLFPNVQPYPKGITKIRALPESTLADISKIPFELALNRFSVSLKDELNLRGQSKQAGKRNEVWGKGFLPAVRWYTTDGRG